MFGTRKSFSFSNVRFVCITNKAEQYDLLHTAEIMSNALKSNCQLLIPEEAARALRDVNCMLIRSEQAQSLPNLMLSLILLTPHAKPESSHSLSPTETISLPWN